MHKENRDERTQRRRQQIIQAALECFLEYGYSETTMAMIRKRSQASTGSIYHHFSNKDMLAVAVYLEGIRDYQEGYVRALSRHDEARGGIFAIAKYHLEWVRKNDNWARYLQQMRHAEFMAQSEAEFVALNKQFIGQIRHWVDEQYKNGRLKKLPEGMFVALLMGPLQEFTRMWLAGWVKTTPKEAVQVIAQAAWNNLKA